FGENPKRLGAQLKVLDYVNHQYPPAFLFTFGGDFLREDAAPMAELLQSRGVEAEYHCYGDEKTGHVAHLALRTPLARKVNAAQANFLLKHSGGEE
ncbi:MAG: alpha/beta hydrolase, partial [bacterium]